MISELKLFNFKSISLSSPINLKALTILCGANSSGKSSIIQSILMISQSLSGRITGDPVSLNGHLVQLGSFGDIKNYKTNSNRITVGFNLDVIDGLLNDSDSQVKVNFEFGAINKLRDSEIFHPLLLESSIELMKKSIDNLPSSNEVLKISRNPAAEKVNEINSLYKSNDYIVKSYSNELKNELGRDYPNYKIIGCDTKGFLPHYLNIEYDLTKKTSFDIISFMTNDVRRAKSRQAPEFMSLQISPIFFHKLKSIIDDEFSEFRKQIVSSLPSDLFVNDEILNAVISKFTSDSKLITSDVLDRGFLFYGTTVRDWISFLNNIDKAAQKKLIEIILKNGIILQETWYKNSKVEIVKKSFAVDRFREAVWYLEYYFTNKVKYLGPLRSEPKSIYPSLGMLTPLDVGLKGQFSAAVFHINKDRYIEYPNVSQFQDNAFIESNQIVLKKNTLAVACQEWLSYIGVICDLLTTDKGKHGYELSAKTTHEDEWQDLTHVGVGVSQMLPIVLMCLLSEKNDILIFEQPELHLHPKIQARLTDFFIAMSLMGRQCIIETHSEYMVNRLRYRIASEGSECIRDGSSIFFVNKTSGISDFQEVSISRYGAINQWPIDFFDQSQDEIEKILIAGSNKKRLEKAGKNL